MAQHARKTETQLDIIHRLLDEYGGRTFAAEAHIRLHDTPAPLFQLLVLSLLLSARIASDNAISACASLIKNGFTTPQKMADATWQQRVDAITWSGYKRYDERTATMLGDTAEIVLDKYDGDLRNLNKAAEGDVHKLERMLQEFKGIGSVGASIFLREAQAVWEDIYPYADDRVLKAADELGLPKSAGDLSKLCAQKDFSRLTAALIRVKLTGEQKHLLEEVKS